MPTVILDTHKGFDIRFDTDRDYITIEHDEYYDIQMLNKVYKSFKEAVSDIDKFIYEAEKKKIETEGIPTDFLYYNPTEERIHLLRLKNIEYSSFSNTLVFQFLDKDFNLIPTDNKNDRCFKISLRAGFGYNNFLLLPITDTNKDEIKGLYSDFSIKRKDFINAKEAATDYVNKSNASSDAISNLRRVLKLYKRESEQREGTIELSSEGKLAW